MKSDIIASVIYLKNKVHKWRNISALLFFFSIIILIKFIFFNQDHEVDGITNYIAEIKIENTIFENDYRSDVLNKIALQDNVKAVLVRVNSPGGGIVGSEILYRDLLAISQRKPLVVLMESVAASGAYMASLASNHIIAHNGTLTGSIGVLMQAPNVSDLANKIGVTVKTYKSSPAKGYPNLTENFNQDYDKIIQSSIDDSFNFFKGLVEARRKNRLQPEYYSEIFDGRVFTGRQALEVGLIDEIGFRSDAIKYLIKKDPQLKGLSIREISIVKKEGKLVDGFLGIIPFLNSIITNKVIDKNQAIMTILK